MLTNLLTAIECDLGTPRAGGSSAATGTFSGIMLGDTLWLMPPGAQLTCVDRYRAASGCLLTKIHHAHTVSQVEECMSATVVTVFITASALARRSHRAPRNWALLFGVNVQHWQLDGACVTSAWQNLCSSAKGL